MRAIKDRTLDVIAEILTQEIPDVKIAAYYEISVSHVQAIRSKYKNDLDLPDPVSAVETEKKCRNGHSRSLYGNYIYVGKKGAEIRCRECARINSRKYHAQKTTRGS